MGKIKKEQETERKILLNLNFIYKIVQRNPFSKVYEKDLNIQTDNLEIKELIIKIKKTIINRNTIVPNRIMPYIPNNEIVRKPLSFTEQGYLKMWEQKIIYKYQSKKEDIKITNNNPIVNFLRNIRYTYYKSDLTGTQLEDNMLYKGITGEDHPKFIMQQYYIPTINKFLDIIFCSKELKKINSIEYLKRLGFKEWIIDKSTIISNIELHIDRKVPQIEAIISILMIVMEINKSKYLEILEKYNLIDKKEIVKEKTPNIKKLRYPVLKCNIEITEDKYTVYKPKEIIETEERIKLHNKLKTMTNPEIHNIYSKIYMMDEHIKLNINLKQSDTWIQTNYGVYRYIILTILESYINESDFWYKPNHKLLINENHINNILEKVKNSNNNKLNKERIFKQVQELMSNENVLLIKE